jgi:hypothetical protein
MRCAQGLLQMCLTPPPPAPLLCLSTYETHRMYPLYETLCTPVVDLCSPGKELLMSVGSELQVE